MQQTSEMRHVRKGRQTVWTSRQNRPVSHLYAEQNREDQDEHQPNTGIFFGETAVINPGTNCSNLEIRETTASQQPGPVERIIPTKCVEFKLPRVRIERRSK